MSEREGIAGIMGELLDDLLVSDTWGTGYAASVTLDRTPAVTAEAAIMSYRADEIGKAAGEQVIAAGDLKIKIMRSATVTGMTTADVIVWQGKRWRVLSVAPDLVGGEVYGWICQGRR